MTNMLPKNKQLELLDKLGADPKRFYTVHGARRLASSFVGPIPLSFKLHRRPGRKGGASWFGVCVGELMSLVARLKVRRYSSKAVYDHESETTVSDAVAIAEKTRAINAIRRSL